MFLDCICGSTTGELGLLGLYINEHNVGLINQTLETLAEYCQVTKNQKPKTKKMVLTKNQKPNFFVLPKNQKTKKKMVLTKNQKTKKKKWF